MENKNEVPSIQRALVLQGGGALGAYEAGVFHVLYHWIKKDLSDNDNVFDIIAGTSIGGINATIIVSKILQNKEEDKKYLDDQKKENPLKYWEGTPEHLINFWKKISCFNPYSDIFINSMKNIWDIYYQFYQYMFPYYKDRIASPEALRRYLSTKKRIIFGEPHVFRQLFIPPFPTLLINKFSDYLSSSTYWFQYSNQPLRNSILEFASKLEYGDDLKNGGINTSYDKKEPRLLLIAANISTSETKAFDSYDDDKTTKGIRVEHVLASAAIPRNFSYVEIGENKYWDGGILSNTPVREFIIQHRSFWSHHSAHQPKTIHNIYIKNGIQN